MELVVEEILSVGVKNKNVRDRMRWREMTPKGSKCVGFWHTVFLFCQFSETASHLVRLFCFCTSIRLMVSYASSNIFLQKPGPLLGPV